jgi:VanZ family protein
VAYGALAGAIYFGLRRNSIPSVRAARWSFAAAMMFGVTDEIHQYLVPGRHADPLDLLLNAVGALIVLALATRLERSVRLAPGSPTG